MTKSSTARASRKAAEKTAAAPANADQTRTVDIMKATPDQLRKGLIESHATIRVMRDEAQLANQTITDLRSRGLVLIEQNQTLAKLLTPAMQTMAARAAARGAKKK